MPFQLREMTQAMLRGLNFGAGPATLPLPILEEAQAGLLNWQGSGLSIMEMGHRTAAFMGFMQEAEALLCGLLNIPDSHQVLFLGGAARLHFAMVPMNFIPEGQTAGYLETGIWSSMAYQEALRLKQAYSIASSQDGGFLTVPSEEEWRIEAGFAYCYYTPNETINGVRCHMPPVKGVPLVADMTSCLLAEPVNVADYGLIFAGAQKNIANAGLTIVIVKKSWLESIDDTKLPRMLDYRWQAQHQSLYATPPTFNCYLALKMFQWIGQQGGVNALYEKNQAKAQMLYDYIDASSFYQCPVAGAARSLFNVCFRAPTADWDLAFVEKAEATGLLGLKGHKVVGGLRASLYNAMPLQGVEKLILFMEEFAMSATK